jgi:apolipoprotein N-acyltransferase
MMKGAGWLRILAVVLSGLLVAGMFPPFDIGALAWVALMPLLWALGSMAGVRVGWKGFGLGFLAGTVSGLVQFSWLATVSSLAALLLPVYLAIFWGLFGMVVARMRVDGSGLGLAFCQAAVWAGLEWLRGWLFTGFSWNGLGVSLHESLVMAQGADLLGITGLTLGLVFVQGLGVFALRARSWRRLELGVGIGVVALWFTYGKVRLGIESGLDMVPLKALLVQINIPQDAGQVLWSDLEIHQAYEDETLRALEGLKSPDGGLSEKWPDWVIWPECALTGRILRTPEGEWATWQINHDTLSQVRGAGPFSLIYGVNELEAEKKGDRIFMKSKGRAYNSIAAMSPDDVLQTYRKQHLVIFGETIPFVETVPFLKNIYEQQSGMEFGGSFTPGDSLEPLPIRAGDVMIGAIPTVCFEDTVARLTRKFVRAGPQVILNVTNDGWFKESPAAAQHFANAKFRAIELRRPMVRCANTGVSAALDSTGYARGRILTDDQGSHFTRGALWVEMDVPRHASFSLYAVLGDWGIILISLAGLILALRKSKTRLGCAA